MSATFDRDWDLEELLPSAERERAGPALQALLGTPCAILDASGKVLWGTLTEGALREPLVVELEPVGHLAAAGPAALKAGAAVLRQILMSRSRYLLAASFHTEAVNADYEAIKASEARYKALSEALEHRVREQVGQIEAQQRQLYIAEKFASVGQLAAGVAHEINNPIGFIRSNLNSLSGYLDNFADLKADLPRAAEAWKRLDLDFVVEDSRDLLKDCIDGADRIARIVRNLKDFSNVDKAGEEVLDINECVHRALSLVANQTPPGVDIKLDLHPLPPRPCQPGPLAEALHNLIQNAIQAVAGKGGEVRVGSRQEGADLVIEIADDGPGIPPEVLNRIFDPFFTTKPVGQGTGLGLTVTRDIVQSHGGTIAIASEPGQGASFTLRFPPCPPPTPT